MLLGPVGRPQCVVCLRLKKLNARVDFHLIIDKCLTLAEATGHELPVPV